MPRLYVRRIVILIGSLASTVRCSRICQERQMWNTRVGGSRVEKVAGCILQAEACAPNRGPAFESARGFANDHIIDEQPSGAGASMRRFAFCGISWTAIVCASIVPSFL